MNQTSRTAAIQVGITGLVALVAMIVGVVWLKEYRLGQKKTFFTAQFEEVGSLAEGDPVAVRGVKKGAVTKITLEDQGVRVEFELQRDVVLHPDVQLRVTNKGFLGEKFLALDPGVAPGTYDRAKPIPGRFQSGVPEVIAGAGDLVIEATELSSRLNLMLDALDPATIEKAAKNVEQASARLSETMEENRADLRQAVTDFRGAAKKLNAIATVNEAEVTTSIKDFGTASRRLSTLSEQLSSTATSLDRVVKRLDSGEGTIGKAIADSTLYMEMKETLRNTNDLVKDIKTNPRRYLKVSVF
ncbi:MAG TPA: MlaD family protein [Candidatus Eisenbacteria bacterium]|nr:MlaD family protein [Candidatus Eisenbacteria bacterium]